MRLALYTVEGIRHFLMLWNDFSENRGSVPRPLWQMMGMIGSMMYLLAADGEPIQFPVLQLYLRHLLAGCTNLIGAQLLQDWSFLQRHPLTSDELRLAHGFLEDMDGELEAFFPWAAHRMVAMSAVEFNAWDRSLETIAHAVAPLSETCDCRPLKIIFYAVINVRPRVLEIQARRAIGAAEITSPPHSAQ